MRLSRSLIDPSAARRPMSHHPTAPGSSKAASLMGYRRRQLERAGMPKRFATARTYGRPTPSEAAMFATNSPVA
jgi:hypothetical protein